MKKTLLSAAVVASLVSVIGCSTVPAGEQYATLTPIVTPAAIPTDLISGIESILPSGWTINVTNTIGEMGHPHGLKEPLFRISFADPTHKFQCTTSQESSPSLILYFYNSSEKDAIIGTIQSEAIYSWDIPLYYDETDEYIIATSALSMNGGCYTDNATSLLEPLDTALKEYFKANTTSQTQGTFPQANLSETISPHAFKGWELYSWANGSDWDFAILVGTNRLKFCDEIMNRETILTGVDALKAALNRFSSGEFIVWTEQSWFANCSLSLPPKEVIATIKQYCSDKGLILYVVE